MCVLRDARVIKSVADKIYMDLAMRHNFNVK